MVGTSANINILERYKSSLKELFNVSQVILASHHVERESSQKFLVHEAPEDGLDMYTIEPADGTKCERCWNYYADNSPDRVQPFGPWPKVCGRCATALEQMGYKQTVGTPS